MNINIQISTIVPDFFRRIKSKTLKSERHIPEADVFVKDKIKKLAPVVVTKFESEIDDIIDSKLKLNRLTLPVYISNIPNTHVEKIVHLDKDYILKVGHNGNEPVYSLMDCNPEQFNGFKQLNTELYINLF
jgi:hypothetical protein